MIKNPTYMIDFLCQIKILQLKMLKLLKIPGFLIKIPKFFQVFFFLISQIPGFSGFQVKWQPCNNRNDCNGFRISTKIYNNTFKVKCINN